MSKQAGAKIFRREDGTALGFAYSAKGRWPLIVDIQDQRGPRVFRLYPEEVKQLVTWLQGCMGRSEKEQEEA